MKLVLIGAGSYVFAPTFLFDAITRHRLASAELTLVDVDLAAAERMAALGRRMARDEGVKLSITALANRQLALPGADAVVLSASPQGAKRWTMDFDILRRHGLGDQARECGGLGGLLNAFRSITLALDVARDMERLCPDAMLLDVTNPMPRVVTAVSRFTRIRCAGFCNIAQGGGDGYEWIGRLLGRAPQELVVTTAGLNHFAWYSEIRDAATGADLYAVAETHLRAGGLPGEERQGAVFTRWLDAYGRIPAGHVDHHGEYLPRMSEVHYAAAPPFHGNSDERDQRQRELVEMADGQRPWRTFAASGSWEHPVDLAAAIASAGTLDLPIINLPNRHCLPGLPDERIVEIPARVRNGALAGVPVAPFSAALTALLKQLSDVHELAAKAAAEHSLATARQAVEIDPAVTDKPAARRALDEMLAAHADMLGAWS